MCENITTTVEGSVITNCTSGIARFGHEGDICIVAYHNVTELWVYEDSRAWMIISSKHFVIDVL